MNYRAILPPRQLGGLRPGVMISFPYKGERLIGVIKSKRGLGFWWVTMPDGSKLSVHHQGVHVVKWEEKI